MPVGIPKVPYRLPGEEDASWVDLIRINRLYRERVLFLGQELKSEITIQITGLMVYLSMENDQKDLYLFINSPGGSIMHGVAIFDMMHLVKPDVQTICMGIAASMGSFILVGGEITKRLAFTHARVMIHQPASSYRDLPSGDFIWEVGELLRMREVITGVYAQRTGQPLWVVSEDMERDVFMSADEARAYGIIDLVAA
uniref:ATP-dependent Clp protease proteolytic subunit n=1 Tax=Tetraena mongolica TaxID=66646 RepID=A0A3G4R320_9ROSI|nr:clp protease proteolytic subunit [Tetraena mongolica]AYU56602.1 clp protease proteolytic subunit [Tetraena mongolica]AYU56698.1 clp protease proteolytic subunit [Tetraena mongolica]